MLTDAQRALIESNHHVIYAVLKKYSLPACEYYDVAAERLCLATRSFRGDPSRFFSYAFVAVSRAVWSARRCRPTCSIDKLQIASPDAYAEAEDNQYLSDIFRRCSNYMTPAELEALRRVAGGNPSRNNSQAAARNRALKKCRAYLAGQTLPELNANRSMSPVERQARDARIIRLRAHGYATDTISKKLNVSDRLVRQLYFSAGKPRYNTSADIARLLGVDRSTVLKYAEGVKAGRVWQIDAVPKIKKPYKRYGNNYSNDDLRTILSHPSWPDWRIAQEIGRSANAVHIKRWRMIKAGS